MGFNPGNGGERKRRPKTTLLDIDGDKQFTEGSNFK